VKYWIHGGFLNLDGGRKMSKSSGDVLRLKNIFVNKEINPLSFRFLTLTTHYRKPMDWSDDSVIPAKNGYENLLGRVSNLGSKIGEINNEWKEKFISAINDDLNMPQSIALLNEMLKSDISNADKLATALDFDKVFGLKFIDAIQKKVEIPSNVKKLVEEREMARKAQNWAKSDELRDKIKEFGYEIKDSSTEQELKKIN